MRLQTRSIFRLLCCASLFLPALGAMALDYGIMPLTNERLAQRKAELGRLPVYPCPPGYAGTPGAVNLLSHLHYEGRTRNQGHTGTCWLWGCTAVMSIDYDVQHGGTPSLTNGLSVQFAASNLGFVNTSLQEGGNPNLVKSFYEAMGYAVPWGNTNADWTDGSGWNKTPSAWVHTRPNVPLSQVKVSQVETCTNNQSYAIATLKSVLDANKALWFDLTLANEADWDVFMAYWGKSNLTEEVIIDLAYGAGHWFSMDGGGGSHTMALVGYDDRDAAPAKHYWLVLNSWGTADGYRPNAVFRMAMNTQYDASVTNSDGGYPMFRWGLLETTFTDKVRKGVASLALDLQYPGASNSFRISGVSFPKEQAPTNVWEAYLALNDRYYYCDTARGAWTAATNGFHYQSFSGVEPALQMDVDPVACTLSFTAANVSAEECRYLDSHYGLGFEFNYKPTSTNENSVSLGGLHAFVYDELANTARGQFTNSAPDSPALSLNLNGTQGVLKIAGETGRTYLVQETDALNTNWWLRATVPMTRPVEEVVLPAPAATNRYWRVEVK
jgi:hypothetical protein